MQYVGLTNQQVSKRMNSHRFGFNNFDSQSYASNVALHFHSYPHSIADFSFHPIDVVKDEMTRLCNAQVTHPRTGRRISHSNNNSHPYWSIAFRIASVIIRSSI